MDEGYLRQRRNLISISILLLLTILAGTKVNLLFPYAKFDNPGVAELFIWIGFSYFWYRTRIYEPESIKEVFNNEVVMTFLQNNNHRQYITTNGLNSFTGTIDLDSDNYINNNETKCDITFFGNDGQGSPLDPNHGCKVLTINKVKNTILSKSNKINNILHGKTFTNYYLPHYIAFITLFAGIVAKLDLNIWHAMGFVVFIFLVSKIE